MKNVLVTGCSSGIGKKTTEMLLNSGYFVYGVDINNIEMKHDNFNFIHSDLSDLKMNASWPKDIDIIIISAAIAIYKNLEETSKDEIDRIYQINVFSTMHIINHYIPILRQNRGNIVNIASVHVISSAEGNAIYATSKHAIVGLTKNLAMELGPEIRVNAISPGAIDTPMLRAGASDDKLEMISNNTPMRRIGKPSDIAEAILFLISDRAEFITGINLVIDGGATLRLHTG